MKKSKLFMASGALILAVTAIFATKANKKFAPVATALTAANGYYVYSPISSGPVLMTTKSGDGAQLHLSFNGNGTEEALVTKSTSSHPVYLKP